MNHEINGISLDYDLKEKIGGLIGQFVSYEALVKRWMNR
jgi:hypothetical protein